MIASFMPCGLLIKITQNHFLLNTVKIKYYFFIISFIIHPKTHSKEFYLENLQTSFLSYAPKPFPILSWSFASFAVFFGSF